MSTSLSFYGLTERYPGEAGAIRYFEERRWPSGTTCPKCCTFDVGRGLSTADYLRLSRHWARGLSSDAEEAAVYAATYGAPHAPTMSSSREAPAEAPSAWVVWRRSAPRGAITRPEVS